MEAEVEERQGVERRGLHRSMEACLQHSGSRVLKVVKDWVGNDVTS